MLEKALFVTILFLDGWEKLLSEDVLVPFFIYKIVSEPTPLAEKQPHTCMVLECFTVDRTDGSAHLVFSGQAFFRMPQTIGKEKMTLPQSSAVQSL